MAQPCEAVAPNRDSPCLRSATQNLNSVRRLLQHSRVIMRGILLWAVGIPIPVIILLYLFHVI
jgi:hypothetical protein